MRRPKFTDPHREHKLDCLARYFLRHRDRSAARALWHRMMDRWSAEFATEMRQRVERERARLEGETR